MHTHTHTHTHAGIGAMIASRASSRKKHTPEHARAHATHMRMVSVSVSLSLSRALSLALTFFSHTCLRKKSRKLLPGFGFRFPCPLRCGGLSVCCFSWLPLSRPSHSLAPSLSPSALFSWLCPADTLDWTLGSCLGRGG